MCNPLALVGAVVAGAGAVGSMVSQRKQEKKQEKAQQAQLEAIKKMRESQQVNLKKTIADTANTPIINQTTTDKTIGTLRVPLKKTRKIDEETGANTIESNVGLNIPL